RPQGVPLLTVTSETVAPGQEIVVQGLGFEANTSVSIFTGRPDVGEAKQALTTAPVDEQGMFTAHAVLPVEFPADAVTAGQLLIVAGGEDGQVLAQTVVQTGQAATAPGTQTAPPAGGEQTQQPGADDSTEQPDGGSGTQQPEDEGDLSQLGFDFETSVLPALNQALSGNFTMDDLTVSRIEARRWPNGCLGLGGEGEFCTQQIVSGFRILVDVNGQAVEVRTNENGSQVRVSREGM
ncbi:MAG TPA: hypothetical protein VFF68_10345, partial [Anaerolineaceae bacterium]|nr:hypothetical protein [Anaerolineaceae bacterium]